MSSRSKVDKKVPEAALKRLIAAYQDVVQSQARFQELLSLTSETMGLEGKHSISLETGIITKNEE